ncbi:protoporphyrinogen oxidase [Mariniblastus sp.]|nr:protoporphyrinogen oxidase [Mariniblastus sp.]
MPEIVQLARKIVVVGGGVSGLAAVLELERLAPTAQITLLDSSSRLGGVLESQHFRDFTIETSADMFTTDPSAALDLVRRLGREGELLTTKPTKDRAYVATDNGIEPLPRGFSLMLPADVDTVLASPILSAAGKQRFLEEQQVPPGDGSDESLESFAVRRFGAEVFERLIQPLAGGIYTADPKTLSMQATMQRFIDMEQEHGSLIAAGKSMRKKEAASSETSGARYGLFRAPKGGVGQLIQWMVEAVERTDLRSNQTVTAVDKTETGWRVTTDEGSIEADAVIVATGAVVASRLLENVDQSLVNDLSSITAASSAIVALAVDGKQLKSPLATNFGGYGIICPYVLGRQAIACSFTSNKFSNRAPDGKMLVRCFIGGALQAELVDRSDDELLQIAMSELQHWLGLEGDAEWAKFYRWRNCMPQYTLGHLDRVSRIENLVGEQVGLELAGNSYRGVGIPACIESGSAAARRLCGV